jgi:hypothetical protein
MVVQATEMARAPVKRLAIDGTTLTYVGHGDPRAAFTVLEVTGRYVMEERLDDVLRALSALLERVAS